MSNRIMFGDFSPERQKKYAKDIDKMVKAGIRPNNFIVNMDKARALKLQHWDEILSYMCFS